MRLLVTTARMAFALPNDDDDDSEQQRQQTGDRRTESPVVTAYSSSSLDAHVTVFQCLRLMSHLWVYLLRKHYSDELLEKMIQVRDW